MKLSLLSICGLSLLLFSGCHKECMRFSNPDTLVFGQFYGECIGERCVEIYKLQNNLLLEDTTDQYPAADAFYSGSYVQLSAQQYQSVQNLLNSFPAALLNEPGTVIGQPDGGDWGGFYIEYQRGNVRKFWLLDKMKTNVPAQYHSFIDQLNQNIALLP